MRGGGSKPEGEKKPREWVSPMEVWRRHKGKILAASALGTAVIAAAKPELFIEEEPPAAVQPADPEQDAEHAARIRNGSLKPDGKSTLER